MTVKVFIPQAVIDGWVASDRVEISGDVLTFRADAVALRVSAASYFKTVSAGSDAPFGLLGRVKSEEEIARLGAEAYMSSVIVGETAYEVEPGFVGVPTREEADVGPAVVEALRGAVRAASS